jgi:ATP-dependent DNA ligase
MLSRSPVTSRRPAGFIDPCLPTLARAVPDGPLWVHEIKHDGYRFIRRRDGDRVRLFTRRGHDWDRPGAGDRRVAAIAAGHLGDDRWRGW